MGHLDGPSTWLVHHRLLFCNVASYQFIILISIVDLVIKILVCTYFSYTNRYSVVAIDPSICMYKQISSGPAKVSEVDRGSVRLRIPPRGQFRVRSAG